MERDVGVSLCILLAMKSKEKPAGLGETRIAEWRPHLWNTHAHIHIYDTHTHTYIYIYACIYIYIYVCM